MVQVVATLAEGYDFSAYGRVVTAPTPDPDLPGHTDTSGTTPGGGPSVGTPAAAPHSGTFTRAPGATATTSGVHHAAPTSGSAGPGTTGHDGSGAPARRVTSSAPVARPRWTRMRAPRWRARARCSAGGGPAA